MYDKSVIKENLREKLLQLTNSAVNLKKLIESSKTSTKKQIYIKKLKNNNDKVYRILIILNMLDSSENNGEE